MTRLLSGLVGLVVGEVVVLVAWTWWHRPRLPEEQRVSQAWLTNRRRTHGDDYVDHR